MLPDISQRKDLDSRVSIMILLQGIDKPLSFSLEAELAIRLREQIDGEDNLSALKTFFCFSDMDGSMVALSQDHIQMVNFLFDIGVYENPIGLGEPLAWKIEIYFRDRPQPYQSVAEDIEELSNLFSMLDVHPENDQGWLSFLDEDGEPLFFRAAHVLAYMARPTYYNQELD